MSKFVKAYLGVGVVISCICTHDTFKKKPELLNNKMLITDLAETITLVSLEWPFIVIDAVRNVCKEHKEEQTNESES